MGLNFSAFLAGFCLVGALFLIGIYISTQIETKNIMQGDFFIGLVVLVGLSTGHYIGKALSQEGSRLNSFFIGSYVAVFLSILFGVFFFWNSVDSRRCNYLTRSERFIDAYFWFN